METRYRMLRRGDTYYSHDKKTGTRQSLETDCAEQAQRLVMARNQAWEQPALNIAMAKTYLLAKSPHMVTRTWGEVFRQSSPAIPVSSGLIVAVTVSDTHRVGVFLAKVMDSHYLNPMNAVLEVEAALTAQNQITVPANVRRVLKLEGGKSRLKFSLLPSGDVLVARVSVVKKTADPALRPFLKLLESDLHATPARIKPFPRKLLRKARSLVEDVQVDLEGPLTGED